MPNHTGIVLFSGSLEAVKFLVEAGADLRAIDGAYEGTPLGWANYMQREEGVDAEMRERYKEIEGYLKELLIKTFLVSTPGGSHFF